MEATESPLDVLSRAAVMLQRNVLPPSYDEARSLSQQQQQQKQMLQCKGKSVRDEVSVINSTSSLPYNQSNNNSGKWKREKKFQQKSVVTSSRDSPLNEYKTNIKSSSRRDSRGNVLQPLDMSKRPPTIDRGEPPSYFQSVLNSTLSRQQSNSTVPVTCKSAVKGFSASSNDDKETMCDQVINEHFRRSLGQDYLNVFSVNKNHDHQRPENSTLDDEETDEGLSKKNPNGCISPSPLSVDDHFAKALGDTWIKLQQKVKCNQNSKPNTQKASEE